MPRRRSSTSRSNSGGKSPLIVFDDADLESAVSSALLANFFSAGEVCSNGTRVFVQRGIYDEFVSRLGPRVEAMKVGDPFDPDVMVGPLISAEHRDKVESYIAAARESAAVHVVGGDRPSDPALIDGFYVTPAVFADCTDDMSFVREEIFGPVMAVLPFDTEDEVVAARQRHRLRALGCRVHAGLRACAPRRGRDRGWASCGSTTTT